MKEIYPNPEIMLIIINKYFSSCFHPKSVILFSSNDFKHLDELNRPTKTVVIIGVTHKLCLHVIFYYNR